MIAHVFLLFFLMASPGSNRSAQMASASGSLSVTAMVTSSVSVTFAADGAPTVIVANAPADAGTLSLLSSASPVKSSSPALLGKSFSSASPGKSKVKVWKQSTRKHKGSHKHKGSRTQRNAI